MRVLAAAVAALALLAPTADAYDPVLAGDVCEFRATRVDDTADWQAVLSGGPIVAADLRTVSPSIAQVLDDNPVSVTLICSIRTDTTGFRYTNATAASASGSGPAVAVVPPTPVTVADPTGWGWMSACTEVVVTDRHGGVHRHYWDTAARAFSTDPATSCGGSACVGTTSCGNPINELILWVLNEGLARANELFYDHVDPAVCPELAKVPDQPGVVESTPEGDLYLYGELVWDCPPYEW